MSKHSDFSEEQNAALRSKLLALKGSQTALGRLLGITHQNVGRLQRDDRSGFSYRTASRLVRLFGFDGVDAFLAEEGCPMPIPEPASSETDLVAADAGHARAAG